MRRRILGHRYKRMNCHINNFEKTCNGSQSKTGSNKPFLTRMRIQRSSAGESKRVERDQCTKKSPTPSNNSKRLLTPYILITETTEKIGKQLWESCHNRYDGGSAGTECYLATTTAGFAKQQVFALCCLPIYDGFCTDCTSNGSYCSGL